MEIQALSSTSAFVRLHHTGALPRRGVRSWRRFKRFAGKVFAVGGDSSVVRHRKAPPVLSYGSTTSALSADEVFAVYGDSGVVRCPGAFLRLHHIGTFSWRGVRSRRRFKRCPSSPLSCGSTTPALSDGELFSVGGDSSAPAARCSQWWRFKRCPPLALSCGCTTAALSAGEVFPVGKDSRVVRRRHFPSAPPHQLCARTRGMLCAHPIPMC